MTKLKIVIYPVWGKEYSHINVLNAPFSSTDNMSIIDTIKNRYQDKFDEVSYDWISMINIIKTKKLMVQFGSDKDDIQKILLMSKSLGIITDERNLYDTVFSMICDKEKLINLLTRIDVTDFDGFFIADINDDFTVPSNLTNFINRASVKVVKNGISNIAMCFIFREGKIDIYSSKTKYEVNSVKEKIYDIFSGMNDNQNKLG